MYIFATSERHIVEIWHNGSLPPAPGESMAELGIDDMHLNESMTVFHWIKEILPSIVAQDLAENQQYFHFSRISLSNSDWVFLKLLSKP